MSNKPLNKFRKENLLGKTFGKLLVVKFAGTGTGTKTRSYWECKCSCGKTTIVERWKLCNGYTRSCSCLRGNSGRIHGLYGTSEHNSWASMRKRCLDTNWHAYHRYGGRGIKICKRWESFLNFLKDMGAKPSAKHSLDRINNDKDYCPSNCRWATPLQQGGNTSRVIFLEHDGKRQSLPDWAREKNIKRATLRARIFAQNWSIEDALTISTYKNGEKYVNK